MRCPAGDAQRPVTLRAPTISDTELRDGGLVAEWLRRGLQILLPRFDSGRGLQTFVTHCFSMILSRVAFGRPATRVLGYASVSLLGPQRKALAIHGVAMKRRFLRASGV